MPRSLLQLTHSFMGRTLLTIHDGCSLLTILVLTHGSRSLTKTPLLYDALT